MNEGREVVVARPSQSNCRRPNVPRRYVDGKVFVLGEAAQLGRYGEYVWGEYVFDDVWNGAEALGVRRVADVDVSLGGQSHRQPDGGRVKYCGQILGQTKVGEAPLVRDVVVVTVQHVEVDEARDWPDAGQRVGDCHGNEDGVCRTAHVLLDENEADEEVREDRQQHEDRRYAAVDGDRELVDLQKVGPYAAAALWGPRCDADL